MITYQGYRVDQLPWWCVHTPPHVTGSPIRPPVGHTAAPSVLLQSVGHSCPTHQGMWLRQSRDCQYFTDVPSIRKDVWEHYHDLPSSGTGSISHGLIFSVSPLSQLRNKWRYNNDSNWKCHSELLFVQLMSIASWSSQGAICFLLFGKNQIPVACKSFKWNTLSSQILSVTGLSKIEQP